MDISEVKPDILEEGGLFGGRLLSFVSLPSTNSWALEHLAGLGHGDVVTAGVQTEGRGRLSRSWQTPPGGNIALSCILEKSALGGEFVLAGTAAALAVVRCLRGYGMEAVCKWPNDVMTGDRKIAGILSESASAAQKMVVGIGLNVNMGEERISSIDPLQPAASMLTEKGKSFESILVLKSLLDSWEHILHEWQEKGDRFLIGRWRSRDWLRDRRIAIRDSRHIVTGAYNGIDDSGRLLLRADDGKIYSFWSGDVEMVRKKEQHTKPG